MSATTMTANAVASKTIQPVTANADMPGKVSKFMHYKNDLISFAKRLGFFSAGTAKAASKIVHRSGSAMVAASTLSTKTGYALAVGVSELFAGAAASITIGVIHGTNQVVGFSIWLASFPVKPFSKDASIKVKRFGYKLTGEIAKFADTVLAGFNHVTNGMVRELNKPPVQKAVMYSSLAIGVGVFANALSGGKVAGAVTSVPKVGAPLASVLRGGKATWIALGCVFAFALGHSFGKTVTVGVGEKVMNKRSEAKKAKANAQTAPAQQEQRTRRRERHNRHVAA